ADPGNSITSFTQADINGGRVQHLDEVPLQVSAVLGTIEIPLQSLLGLEVGDVIPLDTRAGASLELLLGEEDPQLLAKARLGKSEGRVAVQIEQTHLSLPEPEPSAPAAPAVGAKKAKRAS
ncbi:MAG: FliM/FliN family flagellar motor switch protein, partial [Planctomycetota bacterium]